MTVVAIHDSSGVISSVVTCEGPTHPVLTNLPPGFSMTEVQLPAELAEIDLKTLDGANTLIGNYRVEVAPARKAALTRR
jgi:hypothetical protein